MAHCDFIPWMGIYVEFVKSSCKDRVCQVTEANVWESFLFEVISGHLSVVVVETAQKQLVQHVSTQERFDDLRNHSRTQFFYLDVQDLVGSLEVVKDIIEGGDGMALGRLVPVSRDLRQVHHPDHF